MDMKEMKENDFVNVYNNVMAVTGDGQNKIENQKNQHKINKIRISFKGKNTNKTPRIHYAFPDYVPESTSSSSSDSDSSHSNEDNDKDEQSDEKKKITKMKMKIKIIKTIKISPNLNLKIPSPWWI
jgi:hypothetical protein